MRIPPVVTFTLVTLAMQAPGPIARMTYDLKGVTNNHYRKQVNIRELSILGMSLALALTIQFLGPVAAKKFKPLGKLAEAVGEDFFRTLLIVPAKTFTEIISRYISKAQVKEVLSPPPQKGMPAGRRSLPEKIAPDAILNAQGLLFKGNVLNPPVMLPQRPVNNSLFLASVSPQYGQYGQRRLFSTLA